MSILTKKSILVTGGTGSIGTALVKKAINDNSKLIRVYTKWKLNMELIKILNM